MHAYHLAGLSMNQRMTPLSSKRDTKLSGDIKGSLRNSTPLNTTKAMKPPSKNASQARGSNLAPKAPQPLEISILSKKNSSSSKKALKRLMKDSKRLRNIRRNSSKSDLDSTTPGHPGPGVLALQPIPSKRK